MASLRRLVPLGHPQNAIKFTGNPGAVSISPNAQILALNPDLSQLIVSPGARAQTSVVANSSCHGGPTWIFQKTRVLAQQGAQSVVTAQGGLYRVDVSQGSTFECNPAKLVATLGPIRSTTIYPEIRFDIAKFWTVTIYKTLRKYLRISARSASALVTRLRHKSDSTARSELPESPSVLAKVSPWWNTSKLWGQQASSWISVRLFHFLHVPKLRVEGPASILIKP